MATATSYKGHRYPVEVIAHCVWLYHRFALSLRDVEEMMLERGVVVSHETIHQWCAKFGHDYANRLRRRRPRPGDKWHLDEVFIRINGVQHYLGRAVTATFSTCWSSRAETPWQPRSSSASCSRDSSMCRGCWSPTLGSYQVAHREVMPSVEHRRSRYLNNRAENSHQPTRRTERAMKRFASPGRAQRFLSAFGGIAPHFQPRRHLLTASE